MKVCQKCREQKPACAFYAHPLTADGLLGRCKDCHKAAMKANRRDNPAVRTRDNERAKLPHRKVKARQDVIRWRAANPDLYKAQNAINNAIRDGKLTRGACACGAKKHVFGIPADPNNPLSKIKWECARCHHRGRFESEAA